MRRALQREGGYIAMATYKIFFSTVVRANIAERRTLLFALACPMVTLFCILDGRKVNGWRKFVNSDILVK